jgi:hypothetical protein
LMAYVKKPVFGPGRIEARNVQIRGAEVDARAQTGSHIEIDGETVATEELDVERLYETTMRSEMLR